MCLLKKGRAVLQRIMQGLVKLLRWDSHTKLSQLGVIDDAALTALRECTVHDHGGHMHDSVTFCLFLG